MKLNLVSAEVALPGLCSPAELSCKQARATFAHVSNCFSLIVHAPYQVAAPLFGPNGERGWSGDEWEPNFFYPQPGEDVPGAVFSIQHGSKKATWVNTVYDVEARHFQYVYFIPEILVTAIDVNFFPVDARHTKVSVVYTRTALEFAANEYVRALGDSDSKMGEQWQKAINDYLDKHRP